MADSCMPTRPLGRTGWDASVIALGGVKWDTQCSEDEAIGIIRRAIELGINVVDTAHGYGNGQSETRLGLALDGLRDRVFVSTKTWERSYDTAMRDMEESLRRLRVEHVDLMVVHSLDSEGEYRQIMSRPSVLDAIETLREAGVVRFVGVSGHWVKHVLRRIITEYPFDAVICPAGLFNLAYNYTFHDTVIAEARARRMAVLGMKVFGAGRVKHARSVEPYLRYGLHQPVDSLIIGADSVAHVEEIVRIARAAPPAMTPDEVEALLPEAVAITQAFGPGEFRWLSHYLEPDAGTEEG
jgi:aryl-alcohol dehydrogenase-like predicted oxidoreductase